MNRPPPRPTLFPYTTLFRSRAAIARFLGGPIRPELKGPGNEYTRRGTQRCRRRPGPRNRTVRRPTAMLPRLDRKSTRLNSSHGYTSYAVFCVKKKTDDVLQA